jgi:hypothetical protein
MAKVTIVNKRTNKIIVMINDLSINVDGLETKTVSIPNKRNSISCYFPDYASYSNTVRDTSGEDFELEILGHNFSTRL